jgi:HEAT repeat protein
MRDGKTDEALMDWELRWQLASIDPAARAAAAAKLSSSKDPETPQALITALKDPDPQVRRAAATSLGEFGGEPAIRALTESFWDPTSLIQSEAVMALMRIGHPAVPALVPGLQAADPMVRQMTISLLALLTGQPLTAEATPPELRQRTADDEPQGGGAGTSDTERLVNRLNQASMSRDQAAARAAARQLRDSTNPADWEALVTAEVRWDVEVGAMAEAALEKLCRLGDVRGMRVEPAQMVLERLVEEGSENAPETFRSALGHADPNVRSKALSALDDLGEPPLDDDEKRLRALIEHDWDTINSLGPGSLAELLTSQLRSGDRYHRKDAAEALGKLKDGPALDALIDALRDPDDGVRGAAVRALAELRELRAVEPITLLLQDPDRWVSKVAAEALGTLGSDSALPALAAAMKHRFVAIRQSAVDAVGKIGGAGAVDPLGAALKDPDVEVRRRAAQALAESRCAEAAGYLVSAMSDSDDAVRAAAARGLADAPASATSEAALLAGMGGAGREGRRAAAEALQARGWQPGDDIQRALFLVAMENPLGAEALGEAAVESLCVALLDGGHYYLCETAAECLGRLLDTRATPALLQALKSTDMTVRGAAAVALGQIRDPAALPVLEVALTREKEQWVKPQLQVALESVRSAAQGDRLVAALADAEPKVAHRAALLLTRSGDSRGVAWLAHASRSDDTLIRDRAIAALGGVGGPEVIPILISLVGGSYDSSNAAVDALIKMGAVAIQPMVEALAGMEHNGRWVMLQGLARMGGPALTVLNTMLRSADTELKAIVCRVFGGTRDREDIPHKPVEPLVLLLSDPDAQVRRSAAHALNLLEWVPGDDRERALLQAAG